MAPTALGAVLVLLAASGGAAAGEERGLERIAFGSCAKQDQPQPIWSAVAAARPERMILLGDNIYGDSEDMGVLRAKYALLAAQPGFKALRANCPLLATWDDHDYGANDGGAEYPKRRESQQVFLDFLGEPADSPRRTQEGVYSAVTVGPVGKRTQVVLLDTRYFRSPLKKGFAAGEPGEGVRGIYAPNTDDGATMLGDAQWAWLKQRLEEPAELRIIGSSVQVIPEDHGWECWGNFPREREKLLRLLRETGAGGVVLISGDRHLAEISRLDGVLDYPLYEVTSSSLNAPSGNKTPRGVRWTNEVNRHRVGQMWLETNFGLILADWESASRIVRLQVRDEDGNVVLQQRVPLSELQPKGGVSRRTGSAGS